MGALFSKPKPPALPVLPPVEPVEEPPVKSQNDADLEEAKKSAKRKGRSSTILTGLLREQGQEQSSNSGILSGY